MADEDAGNTREQMTLLGVGEDGTVRTAGDGTTGSAAPRADAKLTGSRPASVDAFTDKYEFQDDVHGPIRLNRVERDLVDTLEFQRLFRLGQMGFVDSPFSDQPRHRHGPDRVHRAALGSLLEMPDGR